MNNTTTATDTLNHVTRNTANVLMFARVAGVTLYTIDDDGTQLHAPVVTVGRRDLVNISDKLHEWPQLQHLASCQGLYVNCGSILSEDDSNEKLAKTAANIDDLKSLICYLSPGNKAAFAGHNIEVCTHRTRECSRFCLDTSGKGSIPAVQFSRIARTRIYVFASDRFWQRWDVDYSRLTRKADRLGKRVACRPNGTSDLWSPQHEQRLQAAAKLGHTWYDYSAVPSRLSVAAANENYHVTLSVKETASNAKWVADNMATGKHNAAVVVSPELKAELLTECPGLVFDADQHDYRTPEADGIGRYGLLTPKGQLRGKISPAGMIRADRSRLVDIGLLPA